MTEISTRTINHHQALIYVMMTMIAVDAKIGNAELARIGRLVQTLPAFSGFDPERLTNVAQECGEILQEETGLLLADHEALLNLIVAESPLRMSDIAQLLTLSRGGTTKVIDRLEAMGYVARTPDAGYWRGRGRVWLHAWRRRNPALGDRQRDSL